MIVPITLLKAEVREYEGKDKSMRKFSGVNALIEGEVIELSATEALVAKAREYLAVGTKEVEAEIQITQRSDGFKKTGIIRLVSFK